MAMRRVASTSTARGLIASGVSWFGPEAGRQVRYIFHCQNRGRIQMPVCEHLANSHYVAPKVHVCAECVALGDTWVHLRTCLACGHVGCCDSSKNHHRSEERRVGKE